MVRRFFARFAAALLLFAPIVALGAAPAQAHDTLRQSIPENGARTEPIEAVSLVFTANVLQTGAAVEVTGPSGAVTDGAPQISEALVTQQVKTPLAAGAYTVRWRVLSSDGHPISGTFKFTVVADNRANASTQNQTHAPGASAEDVTPGTTSTAPTPPAQQTPTDSTNNNPVLIIAASVLALLLIGGGALFARSRLRDDAPGAESATGSRETSAGDDPERTPQDSPRDVENAPTSADERPDQHSDTRDHD
ncbi:copper resistance protein CopC [Yimella sp. cx-573]|nr:copper resistance protein CopC [Yimella sp. cx-573]